MTTATQQERVLPRRPRLLRNRRRKRWRIHTCLHLQSLKIFCTVSAPNSVIPCVYSTPQSNKSSFFSLYKRVTILSVYRLLQKYFKYVVVDVTSRPEMPTVSNLGRAANAFRHKSRPRNPTDLEFTLQYLHIPAEFQDEGITKDILVDGRRHILVSTSRQLDVLPSARSWFVDETLKVCLLL